MTGPAQFATVAEAAPDRAAAIAAMAQRLAAAGPRMRQRMARPAADGVGWWGEAAAPVPTEMAGFSEAPGDAEKMAPAPIPWARIALLARRGVLLAAAACCGFGVVYAGMTVNLARGPARVVATPKPAAGQLAAAAVAPATKPEAAAPAPASQAVAENAAPAPAPFPPVVAAAPKLVRASVPAALAPTRMLLGAARLMSGRKSGVAALPRVRLAAWHYERVGPRMDGRAEHRMMVARETLPRWVTDAPVAVAAPRPMAMSPPPGMLHLPEAPKPVAAQSGPKPAPAADPEPPAASTPAGPPDIAAPEMVASALPRIPERPRELAVESGYDREPPDYAPPPAYPGPGYPGPGYAGGYGYPPAYPGGGYSGGYPE